MRPFAIERYYERWEFTAELMLSSSDCESLTVADLLALEPDAEERLRGLHLGYTEVPGSAELRGAIAAGYERTAPEDVVALAAAEEGIFVSYHHVNSPHNPTGSHMTPGTQDGVVELARDRVPDHVRVGFGRVAVPEALARLDEYLG